jgi:hypothetical protein
MVMYPNRFMGYMSGEKKGNHVSHQAPGIHELGEKRKVMYPTRLLGNMSGVNKRNHVSNGDGDT